MEVRFKIKVKKCIHMDNSYMKHSLQRIAVRTQFPPFTWFYRALYALAIHLCVRRFRRIRGVRSVYLRRGLASSQAFYGLSDIDLLVMIGDEQNQRVGARVQYHYEFLRRIIPMLAEGELAVFSPEQFRSLYQYSPFYQHRFNRGRREWKRLFGEDLFKGLSPESNEAPLSATQELAPAWHYLSQELLPDDKRPTYFRRYVAYKWIAEAARAALVAQGEDDNITRKTAILRASSLYPEISVALKKIRNQRKKLLSSEPFSADNVLESYFFLARKSLTAKAGTSRIRKKLRILSAPPKARGSRLFEASLTAIQKTFASLDGIEQAVFVPRLSFEPVAEIGMDPTVLAGATIDAYDLVLVGGRLPPVEMLRDFNQSFARFTPGLEPYFCDGELAVSLQPVRGWPIKDYNNAPEFFVCLSSASPLEGKLKIAECVEVNRPFGREDVFDHRAKSLLALFKNGDVFRLPVLGFFALFWEVGRATWLAAQSREATIEVPVSSEQVIDILSKLTPAAEKVLRRIYQEYLKELRKESSEVLRYMHWCGLYALKLEEMLFSSDSQSTGLPTMARIELTISVVIITRNQAVLLNRALASLVGQERRPDQVVVVDNASWDDTPSVARSYADKLNVTLVREEKIGIPHARNAGIQHCSGDIIAFLDGDCQADRRWLAELEVPFLKDPNIGAVGGSTMPIEGQSEVIARFYSTRMQPFSRLREAN
jgi:hypothetical protein